MNCVVTGDNMKLLNYFRCNECLSTFTSYEEKIDICSCEGDVDYMGRVRQDRTVFTEKERCACDERCTRASGPNCDCICGGVNHGTGKTVTIIVELGKAKVKEVDVNAIDRANEFRKAKTEALERFEIKYKETLEEEKTKGWISNRNLWYEVYSFRKNYKKAIALKVHKRRINTLNDLLKNA